VLLCLLPRTHTTPSIRKYLRQPETWHSLSREIEERGLQIWGYKPLYSLDQDSGLKIMAESISTENLSQLLQAPTRESGGRRYCSWSSTEKNPLSFFLSFFLFSENHSKGYIKTCFVRGFCVHFTGEGSDI
jgi:hypothetical protein